MSQAWKRVIKKGVIIIQWMRLSLPHKRRCVCSQSAADG